MITKNERTIRDVVIEVAVVLCVTCVLGLVLMFAWNWSIADFFEYKQMTYPGATGFVALSYLFLVFIRLVRRVTR